MVYKVKAELLGQNVVICVNDAEREKLNKSVRINLDAATQEELEYLSGKVANVVEIVGRQKKSEE